MEVWFIVAALATFRITSIIHHEEIAAPLRTYFGGQFLLEEWSYPETFMGKLLSCYWCISVWIGAFCSILVYIRPEVLLPFALSTVAIWIYEHGLC